MKEIGMRQAKKEWWKGAGRVRKNGTRVSWEPYSPGQFGGIELNEMLMIAPGCSVQRRGDWLRWIDSAENVRAERERDAKRRAEAMARYDAEEAVGLAA